MPDDASPSRREALTSALSPAEQWTLHHVLLDRLGEDPSVSECGAHPATLRRAFETLDEGGRRFALVELEAVQTVLAAYHHSPTWWEVERPQLESLLFEVSTRIERRRSLRSR